MKPARTTRWQHLLSAWRNDDGAAAAEFALVLPVFLLMVFGMIYSCMLVGAIVQLHEVTENAARCVSVNTVGACTAGTGGTLNAYATGQYAGPAITGLNFAATTVLNCGNPTIVASGQVSGGNQVIGAGNFTLFTGAGNFSVTLSSTACYPII